MSPQTANAGNNDLWAAVADGVMGRQNRNTCLSEPRSRWMGQRAASVRKHFVEGSHCCAEELRIASSINTTTDMNQPYSCSGTHYYLHSITSSCVLWRRSWQWIHIPCVFQRAARVHQSTRHTKQTDCLTERPALSLDLFIYNIYEAELEHLHGGFHKLDFQGSRNII